MYRKYIIMLLFLSLLAGRVFAVGKTPLNFTAVNGPATITLSKVDLAPTISLLYSTDNCKTWKTYNCQNLQLSAGKKVFFKADSTNHRTSYCGLFASVVSGYYKFVMTGTVAAAGNVMSLLDATMRQSELPDFAFYRLFADCSSLITAPSLPATTMAYCCYKGMFENCTSLVSAPALPATTLAEGCYSEMFKGCLSLKQAPALPATALSVSCYQFMFSGCASLATPPALPATTLATSCYSNMFYDCTSLATHPALPATTMSEMCYEGMFIGCTSLTSIPTLPATTLANFCYYAMFHNCAKLRVDSASPGNPWQIPSNAVASGCSGWNTAMLDGTSGTFTGDPVVGVTYYVAGDK